MDGSAFPVDRRRVPELAARGYRVADEPAPAWRGEGVVMMTGPEPPPGRGWLPLAAACAAALEMDRDG